MQKLVYDAIDRENQKLNVPIAYDFADRLLARGTGISEILAEIASYAATIYAAENAPKEPQAEPQEAIPQEVPPVEIPQPKKPLIESDLFYVAMLSIRCTKEQLNWIKSTLQTADITANLISFDAIV
jgi:hypothetical protein